MGLGASLFLIAAGAILKWGVTGSVAGVNLDAIGWILMVVGIIGLVLSMIFWSSWGGFAGGVAGGRTSRKAHRPVLRTRGGLDLRVVQSAAPASSL